MAFRITTHKGRTTKAGNAYSAKHLDRKFDIRRARHIDPERTHLNRYLDFDVDEHGVLHHSKSNDIQAHELAVYERLFKQRLDIINARYIERRHREKCKSLKQFYTAPQTCPDEYLIYIGDKDHHASSEILSKATSKLVETLQKRYPANFIPLSMALHRDERGIGEDGQGSHIHMRCVWICTDKDGVKPSISQGMKEAGIKLPDEDSVAKRDNNRQMVFSQEVRDIFANICENDLGLEIEREARKASRSGRDMVTYQRDQAQEDLKLLKTQQSEVKSLTALEAQRQEQLLREIASLTQKQARLESALSRLKSILLPIQRLFTKLANIRIGPTRTVLDEVLLDAEIAPAYDALKEMEERC